MQLQDYEMRNNTQNLYIIFCDWSVKKWKSKESRYT